MNRKKKAKYLLYNIKNKEKENYLKLFFKKKNSSSPKKKRIHDYSNNSNNKNKIIITHEEIQSLSNEQFMKRLIKMENIDDDNSLRTNKISSFVENFPATQEEQNILKDNIPEEQYEEIVKAVESGDKEAKTKLAYYKLSGYGGCDIDVDEAVKLLKERVEDKDTDTMWLLGLCYEYGMGCEQDLKEAKSLYKQSNVDGNEIGKFFVQYGIKRRGTGVMLVYGL